MATTTQQDNAFATSILEPSKLLESAIDWIQDHLSPEDVFPEKDLKKWADENGYVEEEEPAS